MHKTNWLRVILVVSIIVVLVAISIEVVPPLRSIFFGETPSETNLSPPLKLVSRSGSQLMLDGHPFRFAGANMHWLALEDSGEYAPAFNVNDGFATANAMGLTVIRSHSLGISVGCPNCIEPSLGNFNQSSFKHVDYALMMARQHNMHIIIPLTDNYHYTTGGKHTFTDWFGIVDEKQFYSNSKVIDAFKKYIETLLTHVNTYTGVAYKDDPTIMAWETGNELDATHDWTQDITTYIKSIDANHLIIDGRRGVDPQASALKNVDILSDHYYPMSVAKLQDDANAAKLAGKPFLAGEFQWNESYDGGDALSSFLSTMQTNPVIAGDLFWELWPHNEQYGYDSNEVQFTLHYPGDNSNMQTEVSALRDHAYKMAGMNAPPEMVPGKPLLHVVVRTDTSNILLWQGSIGAASYSVERSDTGLQGPWQVICDHCATDLNAPWIDSSPSATAAWYRVIPYNVANVAGPSSDIYQASLTKTVVDNLNDWSMVSDHSNDLSFVNNPSAMNNDSSAVQRNTNTHTYITWKQPGMSSFQAISYFWPNEPVNDLQFYTSADGNSWSLHEPAINEIKANWQERIYTLNGLAGTNYVKVIWGVNDGGKPWTPALGEISISSNS